MPGPMDSRRATGDAPRSPRALEMPPLSHPEGRREDFDLLRDSAVRLRFSRPATWRGDCNRARSVVTKAGSRPEAAQRVGSVRMRTAITVRIRIGNRASHYPQPRAEARSRSELDWNPNCYGFSAGLRRPERLRVAGSLAATRRSHRSKDGCERKSWRPKARPHESDPPPPAARPECCLGRTRKVSPRPESSERGRRSS